MSTRGFAILGHGKESCRHALVLLAFGALGRILLVNLLRRFGVFPPIEATYMQAARDILRFNFHALGDRVPLYPLLIAVCGLNREAIWVAQSILGIAASFMVFDMVFLRTRHRLFSLVVGLACSLIPEVLIYEAATMTETLTNFLLVTSLWLITRFDGLGENPIRYPLGLGLTVALAGLTRPLMICLVPLYYGFLVPLRPPSNLFRRDAIRRTSLFALPVIVFVLGWCGFNYFNSGYFTPTTRAGQQMMDQVDPYVDLAPDRFAVLRDAWLRSRQREPLNSSIEEVYAGALPEVERQTGKTETQVCHDLASLALYLEIHHPLFCLRRVEQGWMQFWGEPSPEEVNWPQPGHVGVLSFVNTMANFLVREVKATFLVLTLLSIPCALILPKVFTRIEYLTFAMVSWISVCAAFTEFGDNRRFCVPLYMLIIHTVLTRGWVWITATSSPGAGALSE